MQEYSEEELDDQQRHLPTRTRRPPQLGVLAAGTRQKNRAAGEASATAPTAEPCGPRKRPVEQKKIWRQFYKIGDGGDNAEKGMGVGLSTVKSIVTLHGGDCGCKNVKGGVVFWFKIPLRPKSFKRARNAALP